MAGNPICHFELMTHDVDKAKAFYGAIFDWDFQEWEGPLQYVMIDAGTPAGGGMLAKPPEAPHPALNVYFQVDDVEATLNKAVDAGGAVLVPKMEIPGIGAHGTFLDPDGVAVSVFEEIKKEETT